MMASNPARWARSHNSITPSRLLTAAELALGDTHNVRRATGRDVCFCAITLPHQNDEAPANTAETIKAIANIAFLGRINI
jgi:hypothetical protein